MVASPGVSDSYDYGVIFTGAVGAVAMGTPGFWIFGAISLPLIRAVMATVPLYCNQLPRGSGVPISLTRSFATPSSTEEIRGSLTLMSKFSILALTRTDIKLCQPEVSSIELS